MGDEYRRFRFTSSTAEERERLLAEAFEVGAAGAEEMEDELGHDFSAWVYAPADEIARVRAALLEHAGPETRAEPEESLPEVDWSEAWKEGLEALRVSDRLVVRPPFVEVSLEPGQQEIVIDPGQAFGTGSHASTRLCLEWLDVLYAPASAAERFDRVLDVGTGSGVLALAALRLGAESALGFDLDAVSIEAAKQAACENGLADRVDFVTGPIDSVVPPSRVYPLVVANLLKREILPIATEVARRVARGGRLVLAGLLEEDGPEVLSRFAREGLCPVSSPREIRDGTGLWIGLCLGREGE